MKTKRLVKMTFSFLLAICMLASSFTLPTEAEETKFHYVSLGASNTNGYGLRGYITEAELEAMLSGQVSKDDVNVYGYERMPEGGYPDLIRDYYAEIYGAGNVTANQLAISSMRVEELRILLDDTYNGDDYSKWRFTGSDGWFVSAEEGGISELRKAYKESIKKADLVTVDIGWNNFGVYVCNQLVDFMSNGKLKWNTNINDIFETAEEDAAAQQAKEIIRAYIVENVGEGDMADALTEIFAYSILGYMHNFDICIEKIYELNSDVDVVVLGIQNLLHGAVVDLGGKKVPLGDIFGNFVNMANYYISARSPYQTQYQYVKAGNKEHVTIFLDQLKGYKVYSGTPDNLTNNGKKLIDAMDQNVRDCFDYYDNDLYIQTKIDYVAAALIEDEFGDYFSLIDVKDGQDCVQKGKAGLLPTSVMGINVQNTFDTMYYPALFAAYDTLSELVQVIANLESVDANGLLGGTLDIGAEEDALIEAVEADIMENAMAAAEGNAYKVDIDKMLPDAEAKVVAAMYIRYYMGNSFYAHPNKDGHKEIKSAVINVVENPDTEKDQALKDELVTSVKTIQKLLCEAAGHKESYVISETKGSCAEEGVIVTACACGEKTTETKTEAEDHIYKEEATFAWNEDFSKATAVLECTNCDYTTEPVAAKVAEPEITKATCDKDGKTVYTATVTIDGKTYKDTEEVVIKSNGHTYAEKAEFVWAKDNKTAEATLACTVDGCGHVAKAEKVTVASKTITEVTCDKDGKVEHTATATINGKTYTDTKEETMKSNGHVYAEKATFTWAEDFSKASAVLECTKCDHTTAVVNATVTSKTTEATCDKDGKVVYTATATINEKSYTDTKEEVLKSPGHTWDEGVVTKEPTETEKGECKYTCTVCKETKTEEIPALGHTHTYVKAVTAPTCTEAGYTTYTCDDCGYSYTADEVAAKGHTWKEENLGNGAVRKTCTVCGVVEEPTDLETGWITDGKDWYYRDENGNLVTGWLEDNGSWFYLGVDGKMVTGWYVEGDKTYYLDSTGAMKTGWLKLEENWYYFDATGAMKTGWLSVNEGAEWYLFDEDGVMLAGEWVEEAGKTYYLDNSGKMKTGWLRTEDGEFYYFDNAGAMKTGWLKYGADWYFFHEDGTLAMDEWVEDSYVNADGVWVPEAVK